MGKIVIDREMIDKIARHQLIDQVNAPVVPAFFEKAPHDSGGVYTLHFSFTNTRLSPGTLTRGAGATKLSDAGHERGVVA
jgi:hypothetical protein